MKIYLAASFAFLNKKLTEERKVIINEAADILRRRGFEVFVPHEHKIPNADKMDNNLSHSYWDNTLFHYHLNQLILHPQLLY